jgi:hypothetical protein
MESNCQEASAQIAAEADRDQSYATEPSWERVIREELVPVSRRRHCSAALEELDERRTRRQARRGLRSMTRLAQIGCVETGRPVSGSQFAHRAVA